MSKNSTWQYINKQRFHCLSIQTAFPQSENFMEIFHVHFIMWRGSLKLTAMLMVTLLLLIIQIIYLLCLNNPQLCTKNQEIKCTLHPCLPQIYWLYWGILQVYVNIHVYSANQLHLLPDVAVINCHKFSVLKQHGFLFLWSVGQKSKKGLTGLKPRCWQSCILF